MRMLNGNSILVIEGDEKLGQDLSSSLLTHGTQAFSANSLDEAKALFQKYEFDLVICSYYLPDGLIHQAIDWCRKYVDTMPIFVALGTSMSADEGLLDRHLISSVFQKSELGNLIQGVQDLLFDFDEFYEALLAMVESRGINLEVVVNKEKIKVEPIEITDNGIFVSLGRSIEAGTFGLLRISFFDSKVVENFTFIGSFGGRIKGGQHFKINEFYTSTWIKLLNRIEEKQLNITGFLKKVSGR